MKSIKTLSCLVAVLVTLASATFLGTQTFHESINDSNLLSENVEALTITIEASQLVNLCSKECIYSYYYNCILYTNIGAVTCLNSVPWKWL